jgi:uncharacterized protein (TIGR02246 family)
MKHIVAIGAAAFLVAVTWSCSEATPPPPDNHAAIQAIKDSEAQWNKDYQAKDVAKLVAHYADGAVLMSPGAPAAIGRDAITSTIKAMVADPALSLKFEASQVEVAKSGDMAYTQGSYTMTMTPPGSKKPINDKGSYVTVYKKETDGSWKAVSDIASSSVSAAPPPSAAAAKGKKKAHAGKHK